MRAGLDWLARHDRGLTATRRALRTAIVMPSVFAIGSQVIGDANVATFGAFGSFALLLLVDFGGTRAERLADLAMLVATGCVFIAIGTLASQHVVTAVVAMLVVGFGVLFAGVVSSVLASAGTSALLSFILPVATPAPASAIGDRIVGWLIAGGAALLATGLVWPAPRREPLRNAAAAACDALSRRLTAEVSDLPAGEIEAVVASSDAAVSALRTLFLATPYRPTGLSTAARTIVRLVDEVIWLQVILGREGPGELRTRDDSVREVAAAAATLLDHAGRALGSGRDPEDSLAVHLADLAAARARMERVVTSRFARTAAASAPADLVRSLTPSFRAQEVTFAVTAVAGNVELAQAAERRSWWQKVLGRQPAGERGALVSASQRARAHVDVHSVWLHNSIRGAVGLAGAVWIADVSGVQHSFWIVLGALSVLRSNALTTGQNALRGLAGTVGGFVVGGLVVYGLGDHTTTLWILLPLAILVAGMAPAVSFAAGQAGFTVTLLILFNIISPAGWRVGLIRVEDVAIGCAVSLAVGALFWPRGAAASLATALSEAYGECAAFLHAATASAAGHLGSTGFAPAPEDPAFRAAAAARRSDDAFREFLAERGTKHLALAQVADLMTGIAGLRLTSSAVVGLWASVPDSPVGTGDMASARDRLMESTERITTWYAAMAHALTGVGVVPAPVPRNESSDALLLVADSCGHALGSDDELTASYAVRLVWTADHLDAARRLQDALAPAARAAAAHRRRRSLRAPAVPVTAADSA